MEKVITKVIAQNRRRLISGVLLGFVLAILIWLAETYGHYGQVNWKNLISIQQISPVVWCADLFPLLIGLFVWFGSKKLLSSHIKIFAAEKMAEEVSLKFSEVSKLREAAEKSNQAKSAFLAHMSHEIRTPMNAILGMNYLMKKTDMNEKQAEYNHKIDVAAKDLLRIIDDILDFSKIEAGKLTMESVRISLHDLTMEVADIARVKLQDKPAIRFSIDLDPAIPEYIIGDPVRLKQVLVNLLDNAIKFTASGKIDMEIKVISELKYGIILEFSVSDTGIGMSEEERSTVFAPFMQADYSITRKYGGTGLGLAISQSIVEMMDGQLQVESEKGKGSRFHFAAFFSITSFKPSLPKQTIDSRRCLLATQREEDIQETRTVLHKMGFEVDVVSDMQAVFDHYGKFIDESEYYHCLLADEDLFLNFIREMSQTGSISLDKRRAPIILFRHPGSEHGDIIGEIRNAYEISRPITAAKLEQVQYMIARQDPHQSKPTSIATEAEKYKDLFTNRHVLLVEDNEVNLVFAAEVLKSAGFKVNMAMNGEEAIDIAEKEKIDIVLMDIQMPVLDGLETTRRLRQKFDKAELPIIAMTAHAMQEEFERSLQAGMNDHVTKPIDPELLYKTMAVFLKQ